MKGKQYANVTVPNPETANPKEVLTFIDLFEVSIVRQVYDQLLGLGISIPENLAKAFLEKIERGYLFKTEWLWRISAEQYQRTKEDLSRFSDEYLFELKGVHVPRYRKALKDCMQYEKVWLEKDRRNKYDPNAIKVVSIEGIIGHVPADETESIAAIIDRDHRAFIHTIFDFDGYIDVNIIVHYNEATNSEPL